MSALSSPATTGAAGVAAFQIADAVTWFCSSVLGVQAPPQSVSLLIGSAILAGLHFAYIMLSPRIKAAQTPPAA